MEKRCTKCKEVKETKEFSLNTGKPRSWCKECEHEYSQKKYYTQCPICNGRMYYKSKKCQSCNRGERSHSWKGGRFINDQGYVIVTDSEHPNRTKNNKVREHRIVMEKKIGRLLLPSETVHHKNGIRNDNRIKNLELRSGKHGMGQSIEELLEWAYEIIKMYGDKHDRLEKYRKSDS